MKIQICSPHSELQNRVIQALSNASSLYKDDLDIQPLPYQQKSLPSHEPTKLRYRDFHCERREDNTLWCKENGQKLPLTQKGEIDKAQLEIEIALRLW